ncbi:MAG: autotransporter-associated beta strand repeat-containing protein [Planctomycetaceae bacterium]|nr:autotransporter-associated beta strand repeat-containing protein [Planctomycetaceae bacterium]
MNRSINSQVSFLAMTFLLAWICAEGLALRDSLAATLSWDGTGTNWNVLSSWSVLSNSTTPDPGAKPGASDTAVFNIETVNSTQNPFMDGPQSIRSLVFSSLGHVTLRGSASGSTHTDLTVGVGGITNSGANIHATAADVVVHLAAAQTWSSDGEFGRLLFDGPVMMGPNRLTIDGNGSTTVFGPISGTAGMTKQGSGDLSLSASNSFTGGFVIRGGIVGLFDDGALNAAAPNPVAFEASGTLGLFGHSVFVSGLSTAPGLTSAVVENGSPTNVSTLTVAVGAATTNTFAGVIRNGDSAPFRLKKSGAGVLHLTGANTYTGPTTVEQGTLRVDGSIAGEITVKSGAALVGTGAIGSAVTLEAGGTLAPGNSAGVMSVGGLSMNDDATLVMEIGGPVAGAQYDRIVTANSFGALAFNGTLQVSLINGFAPIAGQSFDLFDWNFRLGAFDAINLPALGPGLAWNSSLVYKTGMLSVGLAGDFDLDGEVDGHDFLLWQRGGSPAPLSAADLASWKSNFGQTSIVAVPELSSLAMTLIGTFGIFQFHRLIA